jgi:hypothetical protein
VVVDQTSQSSDRRTVGEQRLFERIEGLVQTLASSVDLKGRMDAEEQRDKYWRDVSTNCLELQRRALDQAFGRMNSRWYQPPLARRDMLQSSTMRSNLAAPVGQIRREYRWLIAAGHHARCGLLHVLEGSVPVPVVVERGGESLFCNRGISFVRREPDGGSRTRTVSIRHCRCNLPPTSTSH